METFRQLSEGVLKIFAASEIVDEENRQFGSENESKAESDTGTPEDEIKQVEELGREAKPILSSSPFIIIALCPPGSMTE